MEQKHRNLLDLFFYHVEKRPKDPFLYFKDNGIYRCLTYAEIWSSVKAMAAGLRHLGITGRMNIALQSGNRPEWVIADLAILSLGAVNVPFYPALSVDELKTLLLDSKAVAFIVETRSHLDAALALRKFCPDLLHVICIDASMTEPSHGCLAFNAFIDRYKNAEFSLPLSYPAREDTASIVYTSGTTGIPKGVELTHGNFLSNIEDIMKIVDWNKNDKALSFLPLCHVFERTVGYYTMMAMGARIYYADNFQSVPEDLLSARPTILVSVPRLYEKITTSILRNLKGFKKTVFYWVLEVGKQVKNSLPEKKLPVMLKIKSALAQILVLRSVHNKTGGKIRHLISGGAPLAREIHQFFELLGFVLIEGYGLTEASPIISCNRLFKRKSGSVGLPLPSIEIKLSPEGELLVKGPNVMKGYFNMPEKTLEVLHDGWLSTGDIAQVDEEGFVYIIDRKKEIIVLSNGKNVAPALIEELLNSSRYIAQTFVAGDKRNYLTALVVPEIRQLINDGFLTETDIDSEDWIKDSKILHFFTFIIENKCRHLSRFEQVRKFRLLPIEFSLEKGELTPSLKYRRKIIHDKYKEIIDGMYDENVSVSGKERLI